MATGLLPEMRRRFRKTRRLTRRRRSREKGNPKTRKGKAGIRKLQAGIRKLQNENRNPESKNKANNVFQIHIWHAKVKRSIKNGFKAQLLRKGFPDISVQCSCNCYYLRAMDIRTLSIVQHNLILSTRKATEVRLLVTVTLLSDLHAICQSHNLAFVPSR